ncbi:carboxypeptidase-like regulatory domain-containing protein [Mucilaginibacter sp.]|uniref:carboxypeptidase-like regulatory domain-containing protein n=1 Tax=Mucilaginibacter sp. TaxID=1882438 RepID=UPI0025D5EC20|nr:carboxypeptidase-like regulatory domain-containing protein [Mucilaginibacter sp.]
MSEIKNISIPKPCHESWQQMTHVEQGRHCAQCCKTVTDFTTMSNNEVIAYLSAKSNVCGRFNEQQLHGMNHQLYAESSPAAGGWKRLALMMGLLSSVLSFKGTAQTKVVLSEQGPKVKNQSKPGDFMLGKVALIPDSAKFRVVTGCVNDENNASVVGAVIKQSSGTTGTQTDINGNFKLQVPMSATQLTASFIGYNSQRFDIEADNTFQIKLTMQPAFLGEVVVIRTPLIKRIYYKCIKRPFRKLFN